jgi:hypothetical protein
MTPGWTFTFKALGVALLVIAVVVPTFTVRGRGLGLMAAGLALFFFPDTWAAGEGTDLFD